MLHWIAPRYLAQPNYLLEQRFITWVRIKWSLAEQNLSCADAEGRSWLNLIENLLWRIITATEMNLPRWTCRCQGFRIKIRTARNRTITELQPTLRSRLALMDDWTIQYNFNTTDIWSCMYRSLQLSTSPLNKPWFFLHRQLINIEVIKSFYSSCTR